MLNKKQYTLKRYNNTKKSEKISTDIILLSDFLKKILFIFSEMINKLNVTITSNI